MVETAPIGDYLDEPPVATCHRCGRHTWNPDSVGRIDQMRQPDGLPCGGTFETQS